MCNSDRFQAVLLGKGRVDDGIDLTTMNLVLMIRKIKLPLPLGEQKLPLLSDASPPS